MMKWSVVVFAAVVALASASPRLRFFSQGTTQASNFYENGNMTILCEEPSSSVETLQSLTLYRLRSRDVEPGSLVYKYSGTIDGKVETWGTVDRQRYTVGLKDFTGNSANFRINVRNLRCEDSAQFRCEVTGTGARSPEYVTQNITIDAGPTSVIAEVVDTDRCFQNVIPAEENIECINCDSLVSLGALPRFSCRSSVSSENARNYDFNWYKRNRNLNNQQRDELLTNNNRSRVQIGNPSAGDCPKRQVSSTYDYGVQSDDYDLVIECRLVGGPREQNVFNTSIRVCVMGLTTVPKPRDDEGTGEDSSDAGMIAGIVIGVIALIVLVVLLVYFLWYRRRDDGETYNTKEDNAMSSDPAKPEIHANTGYDGNNYRHGRSGGYVSRHVDEDDDSIKKPPYTGKDNPAMDDDDFDNDVEVKPRVTYSTGHANPIGSAV